MTEEDEEKEIIERMTIEKNNQKDNQHQIQNTQINQDSHMKDLNLETKMARTIQAHPMKNQNLLELSLAIEKEETHHENTQEIEIKTGIDIETIANTLEIEIEIILVKENDTETIPEIETEIGITHEIDTTEIILGTDTDETIQETEIEDIQETEITQEVDTIQETETETTTDQEIGEMTETKQEIHPMIKMARTNRKVKIKFAQSAKST